MKQWRIRRRYLRRLRETKKLLLSELAQEGIYFTRDKDGCLIAKGR